MIIEKMPFVKTTYDVMTFCLSQFDAYKTKLMLDDVYTQINRLYQNIKKGYLQSANKSLIAASKKNDGCSQDIAFAVYNLRTLYYICKEALNDTVSKGFLWEKEKYIIKERKTFRESLIKINTLMVALYGSLDDKTNKDLTIKEACDFYSSYLDDYFEIDIETLRLINKDYITEQIVFDDESYREYVRYDGGIYPGDFNTRETIVSSLGYEYISKEKARVFVDYQKLLETIKYDNTGNVEKITV